MKKYLKLYQTKIILGACILIAVITVSLFFVPKVGEIQQKYSDYQSIKEINQKLFNKLSLLNSQDLKTLEKQYLTSVQMLLKTKNPYLVFSVFDKIIKGDIEKNLEFGPVSFIPGSIEKPEASASGKLVKETSDIAFSVTATGDFTSFLMFISAAEKNYPLLNIEGIEGDVKGKAENKISLKLFVYPEKISVPAAETEISPLSAAELKIMGDATSLIDVTGEQEEPKTERQEFKQTDIFE